MTTSGSGGRHDNYGLALSAATTEGATGPSPVVAGESQRRPATNSSSQRNVRIGLPAPSCSRCLCPGCSQHIPCGCDRPDNGTKIFIPVTNAIESLNRVIRKSIKTKTLLPCAEAVPMLLRALLASGQIQMRKVDGRETLAQPIEPMPLDLAA
jgi:hypothetical protein